MDNKTLGRTIQVLYLLSLNECLVNLLCKIKALFIWFKKRLKYIKLKDARMKYILARFI